MRKDLVLLFILLFFIFFVSASEFPSYSDKYVNDYANVLSIEDSANMQNLFYFIDQNTTAEIVFLSVEYCSPYEPQEYALNIFDNWKIGKEDKDNGLLILFCANETKIFVMTGYGLEGILPDSKLGRLLDEFYVPSRDSGEISTGITLFSQEVASVIFENAEEVRSGKASSFTNSEWFDVLSIFLIVIIVLIILSRSGNKNSFFAPLFIPSGRSGGFSGGGFSGGFGGGMSGGGGVGR